VNGDNHGEAQALHKYAHFKDGICRGIRINYLPLLIGEETIVLDRRDGRIKRLGDKKPLSDEELRTLEEDIIQAIESGKVELYLTLTFGEDVGPPP